jgi:hypothetical protein
MKPRSLLKVSLEKLARGLGSLSRHMLIKLKALGDTGGEGSELTSQEASSIELGPPPHWVERVREAAPELLDALCAPSYAPLRGKARPVVGKAPKGGEGTVPGGFSFVHPLFRIKKISGARMATEPQGFVEVPLENKGTKAPRIEKVIEAGSLSDDRSTSPPGKVSGRLTPRAPSIENPSRPDSPHKATAVGARTALSALKFQKQATLQNSPREPHALARNAERKRAFLSEGQAPPAVSHESPEQSITQGTPDVAIEKACAGPSWIELSPLGRLGHRAIAHRPFLGAEGGLMPGRVSPNHLHGNAPQAPAGPDISQGRTPQGWVPLPELSHQDIESPSGEFSRSTPITEELRPVSLTQESFSVSEGEGLWPKLPHPPMDEPTRSFEISLAGWERLRRIDREQRGCSWSE